jgi:hypothetical protein
MSRPSPINMNFDAVGVDPHAKHVQLDLRAYDPEAHRDTAQYMSVTQMEQVALEVIDKAEEVVDNVREPLKATNLARLAVRASAFIARLSR